MGRRIPGRSVLCSTNKTAKLPRLSVTRGPPRHSIAPTGGSAGVAPAKRRALSQPAHSNGTPIRLRLCVSLPAGYHRAPQHTLSPQGAGITARLSRQPRNPSFARPRTGVATGARRQWYRPSNGSEVSPAREDISPTSLASNRPILAPKSDGIPWRGNHGVTGAAPMWRPSNGRRRRSPYHCIYKIPARGSSLLTLDRWLPLSPIAN